MEPAIIPEGEAMDVPRSEENGNVPVDAPTEETPEVVEETNDGETPAGEEEAELFELPDGRKVDADTLQTEWKENFAPEFTRRSQELAELKKGSDLKEETPSPYADPDYVPQNYQEIIEAGKQAALEELENRDKARVEQQTAAENAVVEQLNEVKKIDASVDENKLFQHANKYGFRDLKQAHQNMQDMSSIVKNTQKTTAENIAKRNDPVSVTHGGAGQTAPDPSNFETATDFLRSLNS